MLISFAVVCSLGFKDNPYPSISTSSSSSTSQRIKYGRISDDEYRLTPEQIKTFHRDGCVTIPNVLTDEEVSKLTSVFDKFVSGEIHVPGKDFCDMSKPFGIPYEEWSLVNCMLPTKYYPPLRGNIYERITASIARQLFPNSDMTKGKDFLSSLFFFELLNFKKKSIEIDYHTYIRPDGPESLFKTTINFSTKGPASQTQSLHGTKIWRIGPDHLP